MNNLSVVIVILVLIDIVAVSLIRYYYYNSVQQYLTSKMSIITSAVDRYSSDDKTNYNTEVRSLIENYEFKSQVELMAIDLDGEIALTSSGFSPPSDIEMLDFEQAKKSAGGASFAESKLSSGEKILAYTVMIAPYGSEFQAIRMIASLEKVDRQIFFIGLMITLLLMSIVVLMVFTGRFFVRSIVAPLQKINIFARKIASGDFSQRLENNTNDEIGELCDSINFMTNELSNTETMKNEFISSVSHELRTPLTAIKGWSETLMSMSDDRETVEKGMKVIMSETERLSDMVEELLDFSRIQDGRLQLNKARIDILAELGETVLIYQERAKKLNMTLQYYEPEMLPFVYGDKNRLKQVFINIVDNAIKYSDEGATVSVEAYEEDGDIVVSVSDNGMGISAEDLPKVKTKFFKANHTRRGSGIGLAVADEIIQMHGGTLTVKSELGVGTTVMVTVPSMDKNDKNGKQTKSDKSETVNVKLITTDSSNEGEPVYERSENGRQP